MNKQLISVRFEYDGSTFIGEDVYVVGNIDLLGT